MKSNADKYYGITFLACGKHKNFWEKWARQRNQTATAFLIVTSWTCSTLSAQQTSCEWRLPSDTRHKTPVNPSKKIFSGSVTLATSTWTLSVCWSQDHFLPFGQKGCSLTLFTAKTTSDILIIFFSHLQAKQTYKTYDSSIPSYISALANPMRKRHKDNLLVAESTVNPCQQQLFLNNWNFKDNFSSSATNVFKPFFQGWLLQRLGGGYRCCQHLLWQGHCDGWDGSWNLYIIFLELERICT